MTEHEHPTLEPGTPVVCTNRMPALHQPWLYEIYVGIVDEPTKEVIDYNQIITRYYPDKQEMNARVSVLYPFGLSEELARTLIPISPDEAKLSFRDKIKRFLGPVSLAYYDKASCQLNLPEEERI